MTLTFRWQDVRLVKLHRTPRFTGAKPKGQVDFVTPSATVTLSVTLNGRPELAALLAKSLPEEVFGDEREEILAELIEPSNPPSFDI